MKDTLLFLAPPVTSCIILAIMLGYFGNHILKRGIIFIDIAVAQIAALGTMVGLLLGFAEESVEVESISYIFTLIIIGAFALIRAKNAIIPAEAVIGIIYCLGLAMALLLAERIPGGSNYITKTITGNILWVTWDKVFRCALLFSGIGVLHLIFGRQLIGLSDSGKNGINNQVKTMMLELLFYLTFGIVVVRAVYIGGIFLVFTLLIAPSAASSLFCKNWKNLLIWAWIIGISGSVTGILLSYYLNISNGPAIVCLLGLLVIVLALVRIRMSANPVKNG